MDVWVLISYESIYGQPDKQEVEKLFANIEDAKSYVDRVYSYTLQHEDDDSVVYVGEQNRYDSYKVWIDKFKVE